jgi:hypothetical protein
MNAFTMIGFVMLAGIVVNNGILLVDYSNLFVRRGQPLMEACREACASRFRLVLMTALTTIIELEKELAVPFGTLTRGKRERAALREQRAKGETAAGYGERQG